MSSKLLRGTFILTIGTILSKVIGLFYVIPFYQIVGKHGTQLYNFGYVPYTIFISIATAGVPLAVSKFISKYNAIEEYAVGRKLFKSGLVIMMLTGFAAFLIMYITAPVLAGMSIDKQSSTSISEVTTVIRAVSWALIVVPFMSLIRGFFQGHQSMGPSAVSQVVEQIVRILFTLAGAYVVLRIHGGIVNAVSVATFAAFIGAIGSLVVLFWYWFRRKHYLDELLLQDKGTLNISLPQIYKEIFFYAAPFVFVGIANPLYQFIDQITFSRAMVAIHQTKLADTAFSILNFQSQKIVIIPVSLATAFSLTLVPSVTKAYMSNDRNDMTHQLDQAFQVLLFLTLPAAIGLSLLAEPVYTVFYEHDPLGIAVLRTYAPVAILFSLYSVTAAILQGINEQRFTTLSLLIGLLIKFSLNIPLIKAMETQGAVLATALGYTASIILNIVVIKVYSHYPFRLVLRRCTLIGILSGIMWVTTELALKVLELFLTPESKAQSLIMILICAIVGSGIYFYLGLKTKLVYKLFGSSVDNLLKKLRLPGKRRVADEN